MAEESIEDIALQQNHYVSHLADVNKTTFDLSVKNPNGNEEVKHRSPKDILDEIAALDAESAKELKKIRALL